MTKQRSIEGQHYYECYNYHSIVFNSESYLLGISDFHEFGQNSRLSFYFIFHVSMNFPQFFFYELYVHRILSYSTFNGILYETHRAYHSNIAPRLR